ncbi:hypothetical protein KCP91_12225 [Microvirga sp. SRT01]|uniref:Uncharacterized protein n=1 Tax=Sphingomonas longa TaxID=2778730 RepID=A0ABS2D881_9SPHN|nr:MULTISPECIES: hypothetical protein [Alphaproteobacteria]MBM6577140.1 hypothetical protein [Sphingomonas sp. BT552]MBR7710184.1 hypothetical protein [Microvirga sp. SRT01]
MKVITRERKEIRYEWEALRDWLAIQCVGGVIVQVYRGGRDDEEYAVRTRPHASMVAFTKIENADPLEERDPNVSGGGVMGWASALDLPKGEHGWFLAITFFRDQDAARFKDEFE